MDAAQETEFDWLYSDNATIDDVAAPMTGLETRADVMRAGGQDGKDRIWWTDGEYVWFRRAKSNPETLKRHNNFCATGDYRHVETQGDVEVYQLQPQSQFKTKSQIDIGQMDNYNVRRQAALAACRRDWPTFKDVMAFLRERVTAMHVANPAAGEMAYADIFLAVIASIEQRDGPGIGEINREMMALNQKSAAARTRMITIGNGS